MYKIILKNLKKHNETLPAFINTNFFNITSKKNDWIVEFEIPDIVTNHWELNLTNKRSINKYFIENENKLDEQFLSNKYIKYLRYNPNYGKNADYKKLSTEFLLNPVELLEQSIENIIDFYTFNKPAVYKIYTTFTDLSLHQSILTFLKYSSHSNNDPKKAILDDRAYENIVPSPSDWKGFHQCFMVHSPIIYCHPYSRLETDMIVQPERHNYVPNEGSQSSAEILLSSSMPFAGSDDKKAIELYRIASFSKTQTSSLVSLTEMGINKLYKYTFSVANDRSPEEHHSEVLQIQSTVWLTFSDFNSININFDHNTRLNSVFSLFDKFANLIDRYKNKSLGINGETQIWKYLFHSESFRKYEKIYDQQFKDYKKLVEALKKKLIQCERVIEKYDIARLRSIRNMRHGAFLRQDRFHEHFSFERVDISVEHLSFFAYLTMLAFVISPK